MESIACAVRQENPMVLRCVRAAAKMSGEGMQVPHTHAHAMCPLFAQALHSLQKAVSKAPKKPEDHFVNGDTSSAVRPCTDWAMPSPFDRPSSRHILPGVQGRRRKGRETPPGETLAVTVAFVPSFQPNSLSIALVNQVRRSSVARRGSG